MSERNHHRCERKNAQAGHEGLTWLEVEDLDAAVPPKALALGLEVAPFRPDLIPTATTDNLPVVHHDALCPERRRSARIVHGEDSGRVSSGGRAYGIVRRKRFRLVCCARGPAGCCEVSGEECRNDED